LNEGILASINKIQAVIEFGTQGKILNANDNFLNALGYSLGEVRGQHHSMFIEPAYRATPEYREFWAKLPRGEHDANQYKRIGKAGKEVWIQASYNPILDAKGNAFKVVKFATDVTTQVLASQALQAAVRQTQDVVGAAKENDLTQCASRCRARPARSRRSAAASIVSLIPCRASFPKSASRRSK
jgi:methyl-accepting chemotaxis protein